MAKRLRQELPYSPLDSQLLSSVLQPAVPTTDSSEVAPLPKPKKNRLVRARRVQHHENLDVRLPVDPPPAESLGERLNAVLRLRVTKREKREFEALVARLGGLLDVTLKPSNVLRSMLGVLEQIEPQIPDQAAAFGPFHRPPNDDTVSYADFEHRLVRLFDACIRAGTPVG